VKAVGKHFGKVVAKAYVRHGTAWAGLLTQWPEIIGQQMSEYCALEKITWPRKGPPSAHPAIGAAIGARSQHQKEGGTLVIKVAFGRALEVQHQTPQIIDRINAYYGYGAIAQVKIVQGSLKVRKPDEKRKLRPLDQQTSEMLDDRMGEIEDVKLKDALRKLAQGVLSQK